MKLKDIKVQPYTTIGYGWKNPRIDTVVECHTTRAEAEGALLQWKVKQIPWLTTEQVDMYAKESDDAALDCSIEHWRQIVDAGYEVFAEAERQKLVSIVGNHCALCHRFRHATGTCEKCPLGSCIVFGSPYGCVASAHSIGNANAFEAAAERLLNELKDIRHKREVATQQQTEALGSLLNDSLSMVLDKTAESYRAQLWPPLRSGNRYYNLSCVRYLWKLYTGQWGLWSKRGRQYVTLSEPDMQKYITSCGFTYAGNVCDEDKK